jgi:lipoprotein-anchoring transpeptidase ErfK/SrfK
MCLAVPLAFALSSAALAYMAQTPALAELASVDIVGDVPPLVRVPDGEIDFRKLRVEADIGRQRIYIWETGEPSRPPSTPVARRPLLGFEIEAGADAGPLAFPSERLVREMITSSGLDTTVDNTTPRGSFVIENRGPWFYNSKYKEGAKYWISFKNWGEYLFHSVTMDASQRIIPEEAEKLGTKASHGCLRLSVEDAKWMFDHIRPGTKVHVHD